ncbi:MAG TPA: two-component sensor histidine kinase, partial [Methylocystis sp.]|nr:two-component sensor histidine kinase [Methylocystis sp.]
MNVDVIHAIAAPRRVWRAFAGWLHDRMPKGLYARALLIVILPIVLLQSAVAYVYMQRHWEAITDRLSASVARDVAAISDLYARFPDSQRQEFLTLIAGVDLS